MGRFFASSVRMAWIFKFIARYSDAVSSLYLMREDAGILTLLAVRLTVAGFQAVSPLPGLAL